MKYKNTSMKFLISVVTAGFLLTPCVFAETSTLMPADPAGAAQLPADQSTAPAAPDAKSDSISLDFKDAEIGTVLRVLSMKSGMNIVAGPEVKGLVTVRLDDVPWDRALDVILRTYDYVFERDGNVIRVTTREKMGKEPVETKTFILNYSKAQEIQTAIQDILSERGRIKVAERTNMLVVTDIPTNLYKIGEVIRNLDKVTSQAFIDSKIVRTDHGTAENMGIQWTPSADLTGAERPVTFPFSSVRDQGTPFGIKQFFPIQSVSGGGDAADGFDSINASDPRSLPNIEPGVGFTYGTLSFRGFKAALEFLQQKSNTKVVSNPRIVVLNNQTAKVQVGDETPIPKFERNENTGSMEVTGFSYRDVGVVLEVTPHINSAEEILVDLKPEVSSRKTGLLDYGDISAPEFTVTKAITQVLIQSGQTIAIGGLMTDNVDVAEAKVPYLGDIPFFGKIFRSKRQTPGTSNAKVETLFFITVTMVDSQGQPVSGKDADQNQNAGAANAARDTDKKAVGSGTEADSQGEAAKP